MDRAWEVQQREIVSAIVTRLRRLETQEPAIRVYAQDTDPSAIEEVGEGCMWIDTTNFMLYYRSSALVWETLTLNAYTNIVVAATGYIPIVIGGAVYKVLVSNV